MPKYQKVDLINGRPVYTIGRCFKCGNEQASGSLFIGGVGWVVACCRKDS